MANSKTDKCLTCGKTIDNVDGFCSEKCERTYKPSKGTEEMNKGIFKDPAMASQAAADSYKANLLNKPAAKTPHVNTLPSPEEHVARASMYDDFMPQGKFTNFSKGEECLKFDQNGQWSLTKTLATTPNHGYSFKQNPSASVVDSAGKGNVTSYKAFHQGKPLGILDVHEDSDGKWVGSGSVDFDEHPHIGKHLLAHHNGN